MEYCPGGSLADRLDGSPYLDGRPVLARPVSAGERLLKWVRRSTRVATHAGRPIDHHLGRPLAVRELGQHRPNRALDCGDVGASHGST
jgi:hypothetical protein